MSGQLQLRRGTTAQNSTFTGAVGELTYNTDDGSLISHDGVTAGGYPGGGYLAAPGAVVSNVQTKLRETISVKDFGAVGDNATNDVAAFQSAIDYCASNQTSLYIPEGAYVLGDQLTVNSSFDIRSDKTAALRWTSTVEANCGIVFDFQDGSDTLCEIELPQLFSAGVNSSFNIPGYGPSTYTYDLNARYGNGIYLKGGNRVNVTVQYMVGWQSAILVGSTPNAILANVNINVNTIDFCVKGIAAFGSATASLGVSELVFTANTVWAKYPIFIDCTNQFVLGSQFNITGSAYVNEPNGSVIYASNASIVLDTCKFVVNRASSGYQTDSTTGVATTLICPFIAGDGSSNGVTTDGNATVGYFKGKFCEFDVGPVMGIPTSIAASSPIPVAGNTIRVRDGGQYNLIRMRYSDNIANTPIPVASVVGEANYNGGVGGAQYSNKVYCSVVLPALPSFNGVTFYMYHQCVEADINQPLKLFPRDSTMFLTGVNGYAKNDAGTNNRQIVVEFINTSTVTTSPTTVYFWVELP